MKNRNRANGKTKAIIALAIVLVLTVALGVIGVTGIKLDSRGVRTFGPWLPTTNADSWPQLIELGLDLRGGVYVEYSAKAPEGSDADFETLLQGTMSVIQNRLTDAGYANYYVGTVEAEPTLDDVLAAVKAGDYTKVVLRPLMIVAGDHANNDMAGDEEDSWKSAFEAAGYEVTCEVKGLGELEAIQQLLVAHAQAAIDSLSE